MKIIKKFINYLVPTYLCILLSSIYSIVDGVFIGNAVGDVGVSAISLVFPLLSVIIAVTAGIGMGAGVVYSIESNQKTALASKVFTLTCWLLLLVPMALAMLFYPWIAEIISLLKASGEVASLGALYLQTILLGMPIFVFSYGLLALIRNLGGANFNLFLTILGCGSNIVLDWLFIYKLQMGVAGAAYATILAQFLNGFLSIAYILRKGERFVRFSWQQVFILSKKIFANGLATFGLVLSADICLIMINKAILQFDGVTALTAYSVLLYTQVIVYFSYQAIGDSLQPLASQFYAKQQANALAFATRIALAFTIAICLVLCAILYGASEQIGLLFGVSAEAREMINQIVIYIIIGLIFIGPARLLIAAFFATEKVIYANSLVYMESFSLVILVLILPLFFGIQGVWLSIPLCQFCTFLLTLYYIRKSKILSLSKAKPCLVNEI